MTKIRGTAITIPGFTVGLQQDTAIAPLGSFVSASNLIPLLGSRMGIRGGSRVVNTLHDDVTPTGAAYQDTFVATGGDGEALPSHTPTGGGDSFHWVTGTYTACLDFFLNQTASPTNTALLPTTGWPTQSLLQNIITGILPATTFAVDVTDAPASNVAQSISATITIPSGMTQDAFVGLLLGASADGSGGYALTVGYHPSIARQRITLWSRDAAGVMTILMQGSQVAPDLFAFDTPTLFALSYDGVNLSCVLGDTPVTISTPGHPGLIGARSDNGTDILRMT